MKTHFLSTLLAFSALAATAGESEFALAFRFRTDPSEKDFPVAYGLMHKGKAYFAEAPFEFSAKSVAGVLGATVYKMAIERECAPGAWHHVAFAYSATNGWCRLWFDGKQQQEFRLKPSDALDADALLKLKPDPKSGAEVEDVKTFKRLPKMEELFAGDVDAADAQAAKAAFEQAASAPGVTAAFAAWCRAKAKEAAAFGEGSDLGAWHRLETLRHRLPKLLPLAAAKVESVALPFAIDRYAKHKHVPFAVPSDAQPFAGLELKAALGEWDCASFMVHPLGDAKEFFLKPTDLKGPDGAVIPGASVDIRVVKCWYQCRGGWNTYFAPGRDMPTLCPELLLHDDAFMRVDTDARKNLLRVSYPDGDAWVDVSERVHEDSVRIFNYNLEPVADAKEFRPLDLREGEMRQFWITLKVPEGQKPGAYAGAIEMTVGGKPAGSLPFAVTVHPFRLPWPGTHYDIDKPMIHGWYHHCSIDGKLKGEKNVGGDKAQSYDFDRAVARTDAEFRNMIEHGMGNICCATYGNGTNEWDISDANAVLLKRNGANLDLLFGDMGVECEFAIWNIWPPYGKKDLSVEANYDFWKSTMIAYSNRWELIAPKLKEVYGHTRVMCYGFDEAGPETVRREMPFMATADHFGGFTYTSQGRPEHAAFITDYDGCPQDITRETAHSWHASGAILTTYARPHGGPENPDLWRRRKGLYLWFSDFDGQFEYIWYEGDSIWNEFVYGASSSYKNFCMVQPTSDGVIDSVQWEAAREGVDDMRYATLLKRLCRAARATGDAKLVKAGREFDAWLELCDYKTAELEGLRAEIVRRIVPLRAALAAKGVDVEAFAPPLPAKQDLPLPKPKKMTGDGYAKRNMLDYACRAWLEEGTEEGLFKAYEGYLKRRMVKEAEALLKKVEDDAGATPAAKARARLSRGFLGLTPTRHDWAPAPAELARARKALDYAVQHDQTRVGGERLALMSQRLMRAFSAAGDHLEAAAVGEKLKEGPLKKYVGGRGSAIDATGLAVAIGEEYFALGRYKRAMEWFSGPAKGARYYHAIIRYADAAKALGDYVTAMASYADAANTIDRTQFEHQYQQLIKEVAKMSEAIRKHSKQKPSASAVRNTDADDAIGDISLDDD